jgi:uncharacterized protein YndB with AHSA1/START domain
MGKEFECERDEVVIRGADDHELVANVERHLVEAHPDLVGKVRSEDILAAASEVSAMRDGTRTPRGDGLTLRMERTLPAPRETVYRALTNPRELAKWWGPRGFTAPSVEFEPRAGRSYRIAMQPPDGDLFFLSGEFERVDPPARLAYTFRWDPPGADDRDTLVTLSLRDRGETTEVLPTQVGFATEERRALHDEGWSESFGRLEQVLDETARSPEATPLAPLKGEST